MMSRLMVCALSLVLLTGGKTATQGPDDPMMWSRFDCQRSPASPQLDAELKRANQVCGNVASTAVTSAAANMPTGGTSIDSAVLTGIEQHVALSIIHATTAKWCMAEHGYTFSKRSEFEARCPVPTDRPKP